MVLPDFNLLTVAQQMFLLYKKGVYVGKRKYQDEVIVLYQLDSFYVEVYYHHYRTIVDYVVTHTSTDCLDPYLQQVNIKTNIRWLINS